MAKAEAGKPASAELKPETKVTTGGRKPHEHHGYVNTPVYHASTLLYRTAEDYLAENGQYRYGRLGTPTSEALEKAIQELDQAEVDGRSISVAEAKPREQRPERKPFGSGGGGNRGGGGYGGGSGGGGNKFNKRY